MPLPENIGEAEEKDYSDGSSSGWYKFVSSKYGKEDSPSQRSRLVTSSRRFSPPLHCVELHPVHPIQGPHVLLTGGSGSSGRC